MDEKCGFVNTFVTEKYWYYLRGAKVIHASHTPTSQRYYCVNVYVNIVGTFLVIGNYELGSAQSGINTFVRLGNGYEVDSEANYGQTAIQEIKLSPAVLEMANFGQWFIIHKVLFISLLSKLYFYAGFIKLKVKFKFLILTQFINQISCQRLVFIIYLFFLISVLLFSRK